MNREDWTFDYDKNWARVDADSLPVIKTDIPGPVSKEMHGRASEIMKGYSGQVRLFPVVFKEGKGCTLTDVDGNQYIDFSSGIYVTGLGHCHPKISEAVARYAKTLMNCHDFTTPIKMKLLEKLADVSMGDLNGVQLYSNGTAAVEAGLRLCRAATDNIEFVSFFRDFHGKTMGAVNLAVMSFDKGTRQNTIMVPRPYCYRCPYKLDYPDCGIHCADMIEDFIENAGTGRIAAIVAEPIQGWAGTIIPPDEFFPRVRKICDKHDILLFADEVLTCMGRTGEMFCMEHWDTLPDVMTLGKGFGNGFPVTAMLVREKHKEVVESISASTSYGGNPMACAAALASIEVIEEEGLVENSKKIGDTILERMQNMREEYDIVGEVRGKGCLLGMEMVKDKKTKEPFAEAGKLVYQKAFAKGLAWVPAGHIIRMSPPLIMDEDLAMKGMDIIEEAVYETQEELEY